ncbi:pectate lyase superfamily protein-domain-containing protein [Achaetomium macrosporum]|uniref:Acyl-coenzyme A diphosphatase SCS3 n=1 Tax=Achaetomium macrosporum TaxID=79813 RepID=A0AAN7HG12_9PEZI|nr:pectate lyase superfamily protein-domain-containing protein [Achaetomium macrosporum]
MMLPSITTLFLAALGLGSQALAAPSPRQASGWWLSSIQRQGAAAFNDDKSYKVFRNVKDYGAKGDGSTDDTAAINAAISDGNRCGQGCSSQTTTPALVYFPPGTYVVSKPIVPFYYTQLVGDAVSLPTLKAAAGFSGMAVIDADPYNNDGRYEFGQIRNFQIDLTAMPVEVGAGIHWQVAQATSLQNIVFNMRTDGGDSNKQQGIFMDNGSGGFMTDLTFNGGNYGAFLGNQQFTTRNLTFNNCKTAIFMNWNWAWTFHGVKINNCGTVGSVLTAYDPTSPQTNGTLILENVDMTGTQQAIFSDATNAALLPGNQKVSFFAQGRAYGGAAGTAGKAIQGPQDALVTRSKPQYENVPVGNFVSVKANGAKGDGATPDQITVKIWPLILAGGDSFFKDQANPKPVFQVGQPGDKGEPGAIMMEWNVAGSSPAAAGLWDLELEQCAKNPDVTNPVNPNCFGAFMMLHIRAGGSAYLENTWYWIDVFNGRGVLIEGEGPVWGWGTASEHSVLYNYQFNNASNIFLGHIQTETPYYQGNPDATKPFTVNSAFADPDFAASCADDQTGLCKRSWGVRAVNSKDIFVYGAGLYSFFDNYSQDCLKTESCQSNMVSLESSQVHFFGLSTKASVNMLTVDGQSAALDKDNRNNFCATLAFFQSSDSTQSTMDGTSTNETHSTTRRYKSPSELARASSPTTIRKSAHITATSTTHTTYASPPPATNRRRRNSPYLPTPTELALLSLYPAILAFGTLYAALSPETRSAPYSEGHVHFAQDPGLAPSYFARKDNWLNVLFVKRGWAWISGAFFVFLGTHPAFRGANGWNLKRVGGAMIRWGLVTAWWVFVTQWFFGPAIIDRGFRWTGGKCEVLEAQVNKGEGSAGDVVTAAACRSAGGHWRGGHDISGHVFLLVLGSFFLVQEVGWVAARWARYLREERSVVMHDGAVKGAQIEVERRERQEEEDVRELTVLEALGHGGTLVAAVAVLCGWMLLMTAIYFHTWFEKLTGLLVAFAGLYVTYILPRCVPALRGSTPHALDTMTAPTDGMAPVKVPANLPELVRTAFNRARASGDVHFFPTQVTLVNVNSVPFQLRFSPALANKPRDPQPPPAPSHPSVKPFFDPFDNPPEAMLITPLPPTHNLVLNKFAIIPEHFILATQAFKQQTDLLEKADLDAAYACIEAYHQYHRKDGELFVFYNSGPRSGSSQPHRHLQLLPVSHMREGLSEDENAAWVVLADSLLHREELRQRVPFQTFVERIVPGPGTDLSAVYARLYRRAVEAVLGPGAADDNVDGREAKIDYNLAMTRDVMVIAPRVAEGEVVTAVGPDGQRRDVGKLALNGTVLAGTALVKHQEEWDALRAEPEQLLQLLGRIGVPTVHAPGPSL